MCINIGIFMLVNALALCLINMYFFGNIPIDRFFELMIESLFYPRLLLMFHIVPMAVSIFMIRALVRFCSKKKMVIFLASTFVLVAISPLFFQKVFHISVASSPFYKESKGNLKEGRAFLIAHAGGGIDGHIYTNSREAVENSLERGYSFIELDLLLSKDEKIVAAHDWENFYKDTGLLLTSDKPQPLSVDEFKARKIHGKYTTLAYDNIINLLRSHETMVLVTDKLRDINKLNELYAFNERIIIESFSLQQYDEAKKAGYKYPAYAVSSVWDIGKVVVLDISMITVSKKNFLRYPTLFKNFHEQKITILVHTVDDEEFIEKYHGTHFSLLYTNFL